MPLSQQTAASSVTGSGRPAGFMSGSIRQAIASSRSRSNLWAGYPSPRPIVAASWIASRLSNRWPTWRLSRLARAWATRASNSFSRAATSDFRKSLATAAICSRPSR